MTQLALDRIPAWSPPRRRPSSRTVDRARARLLAEAARVLPWPRDVVRDVVLSGTLVENLAALQDADNAIRELQRRARLVEGSET
jgi:hypothetical protein